MALSVDMNYLGVRDELFWGWRRLALSIGNSYYEYQVALHNSADIYTDLRF